MYYRLYTLADITATGQYRNEEGKEQARNQQQNFDTVLNTISMRANLFYDTDPITLIGIPNRYGMKGKELNNIWIFEWSVESRFRFKVEDDDVGLLKQDFSLVPYTTELTETAKFSSKFFMPSINIHFEMLR